MSRDYIIHTPEEIARIRVAAAMAGKARDRIAEFLRPGMSTKELDLIAGEVITSMGGKCAFLGYHGYPGNICISVNDEVVHGIGSPERFILKGDLVSIDVGVEYEGGVGDTARTDYVGDLPVPAEDQKLMDVTREALEAGKVIFFAGGTGHPYFSTDTGAVLRAIEIEADAMLLAKAIDGIYDSDPKVNPEAVKYDEISIQEVIDKKLAAVDLTASIMCLENKMPMLVFGLNEENSIVETMSGNFTGTKVTV